MSRPRDAGPRALTTEVRPIPSPRPSLDSDLDELDPLDPNSHAVEVRPKRSHDPQTWSSSVESRWRNLRLSIRMSIILGTLFVLAIFFLLAVRHLYYTGRPQNIPGSAKSVSWFPTPRAGTVPEWQHSFQKAAELLDRMTLSEKINITTGTGWMMDLCVGNTGRVDRLGFPSLCLQDGPLGIRFADHITAFPAGLTVGATWNSDLMYQRGRALGLESRKKGVNVLLGPSMGPLGRLPAGGRNFEGFGADPVLQAIAAASTIRGIQDEGVMATAKHYIANEQEHFRQPGFRQEAISSNIDDRTMHEIYAWPFADSIRAGVASVMCSYNQLNNSYACENSKLLNGILKDELGFQGFVQSDWLAQRSGVNSALSGLDMSMPGDGLVWEDGKSLWGPELTKAVLNGTVPVERLNDMVLRVVAAWYQLGQDDTDKWPRDGPNFSSWTDHEIGPLHPRSDDKNKVKVNSFVNASGDHHILVRQIGAEGTVLVKNDDDILPLSRDGLKSGRRLKLGIFGEDAFANPRGPNACEDKACNEYTLASGWGSSSVLYEYISAPADALDTAFDADTVDISHFPSNQPDPKGASDLDLCMVFVNSDSGEGYLSYQGINGDRNDLYPQKGGDKLVQKIASNCGNGDSPVIVVVHSVGPVIVERWIDLPNVKAVLMAHLPGQESGNALVDVLFGHVNPSGRLPYTIGRHEDDYGPSSKILIDSWDIVPQQDFTERLYIDYRYFDANNRLPRFEFGFGLSYTKFAISNLNVTAASKTPKALPAPRTFDIESPRGNHKIPKVQEALFPKGMRILTKYIYPYLRHASEAKPNGQYPYPRGYSVTQHPSDAGGGSGGNPDLYTVVARVTADVANLGDRSGACVVQLYVSFPEDMRNSLGQMIDMPPRVLRGFKRVSVGPQSSKDGTRQVEMELTRRDLSFWDVGQQNWVMSTTGHFRVWLGQSSRALDVDAIIPFDA